MIEDRSGQVFHEFVRLHHLAVVRDGSAQPLSVAGEPEGIGAPHAVSDDTVDISFRKMAGIEIFTAGIDIRDHMVVVLPFQQCRRDIIVCGDHPAEPTIKIGDNHGVTLASQPSTQILHLSGQPPPIVEEHKAWIGSRLLRPE